MAFSWISVSVGTIAAASHVNEVKTNTDTLATNLGIANYGWVEMPVVSGDFMEQVQIQELQDALDYIDTNNTCSSENASKDTTVDSGDDVSVDAGDDTTVDSGENGTYDSDQNLTINTDQNTSVLNDQHGTYDSNQNTTIYSNQNTTVYTSHNTGVK